MTAEEEFDLKMDVLWYQKRMERLEPSVKKFIRWFYALYVLSFVYGVVVGALIF